MKVVYKLDPVQNWIDSVAYSHSRSRNTARAYRWGLNNFCEFIEKTPQEILGEYERMTDTEFKRKYARYIRGFIGHLSHRGYTMSSVNVMVCPIKSFFKYNDLPLAYVPTGRKRVTSHNRDITREEIMDIPKLARATIEPEETRERVKTIVETPKAVLPVEIVRKDWCPNQNVNIEDVDPTKLGFDRCHDCENHSCEYGRKARAGNLQVASQ